VAVDPSLTTAVVALGSPVADGAAPVGEVGSVVPLLPVAVVVPVPDGSPGVVVEPVGSVVGVGLPADPSPPAVVGVGPVSFGVGRAVGGGPVLTQPGGAVGVGLTADGTPAPAPPAPLPAAELAPPPTAPTDPVPDADPGSEDGRAIPSLADD
jgi:hypothetical protein